MNPRACPASLAALGDDEAPDPRELAEQLINELLELDGRIMVVPDDFHRIQSPGVLQLLSVLLERPLPTLHIVIVTRRDPQMPLASLRAAGRLHELRMGALRFSPEESLAFLRQAFLADPPEGLLAVVKNMGGCSLLPVFPLRTFRHKSIFIRTDRGITTPADLKGRKVGTPGFSPSSLTWLRGIMEHEYGLKPSDVAVCSVRRAGCLSGTTQDPELPGEAFLRGISTMQASWPPWNWAAPLRTRGAPPSKKTAGRSKRDGVWNPPPAMGIFLPMARKFRASRQSTPSREAMTPNPLVSCRMP